MADEASEQRDFAALLKEMPRIAEVVNAFSDETIQKQAFDALVGAFWGDTETSRTDTRQHEVGDQTQRRAPTRRTAKPRQDGATKQRRSDAPRQVKDLDLAPKGKKSFADFVVEKQPKSQDDKNVLSVYWLIEIAKASPVTIDHVYTCYRDRNWPLPTNMANRLALTSSRKRFLNTSNYEDIQLTSTGTNHVEHNLPPKTKGRK